jgi:hypothetical protein
MTYAKARQMLQAAQKRGYVKYHQGIVSMDNNYGINIDGDGHDGRLFGCPKTLWAVDAVNHCLGTNYILPKAERGY